jgi:hypothetical protein
MKFNLNFTKTAQLFLLLCVIIGMGHFTQGLVIAPLALAGCGCALAGKRAWAVLLYMTIPFITIMNPVIMPRAESFFMIARLTTVGMCILLWFSSLRVKRDIKMPIGGLFVFLAVAILASMQGILPLISILKIVNFGFFILGLYLGTRDLSNDVDGVRLLRSGFMAFSMVIVFGSLLTLFFPSIAYYISVSRMVQEQGVEYATEMLSDLEGMSLFCGVTWQSQALAPILALVNAWLLCDMLIIQKRFTKLHMVMLLCIPAMLYMTRSRAGLVAYVVSIGLSYFFALRSSGLSTRKKSSLRQSMTVMAVIGVLVIGVWMIRSTALLQWIRKTDDVNLDSRSLAEAFTSSRMGLIEIGWDSFLKNPFLGIGFQVSEIQLYYKDSLSLFSAPIEKGFLPTMILEETGLIGAFAFVFFLSIFINSCRKKELYATLILFFTFFATNLAEATFFSPGGTGGLLWCYVAAGFVIDTMSLCNKRLTMRKAPVFRQEMMQG